ncbi:MAG: ankyrin repeat domain-containing protein [Rickettsiales bacterium]|jgi:ankyrin repeat protein|nr:ankyrin repeat domain-containing protein [Rickettsiales bacterium]
MNEIQQEELNRQLFDALMQGNVEQAKKLAKEGANILEAVNEDGMTVLHLVAINGQEERAEMLIKNGADINKEDNEGMTPLHRAAINGQEEMVELLIRNRADINKEDNRGMTSLHWVVFNDQEGVVRALIKNGADVNREDNEGVAPLHRAAINGQEGVVELLIRNGAGINKRDNRGMTSLHWAAFYRQEGMVRALIKSGADVNAENSLGTSLDISIRNGHTGITELIVNRIVELEAAGSHVSERNLQLKAQIVPEIKKRIFLHNYKPLIDALPQLGYHGDNTPDGVKAFLEENRDRFKVRLGIREKSLVDLIYFEDVAVRHVPTLQLCAVVSEVVRNNTPNRNLNNPNTKQLQAGLSINLR